jgi:hypothetical protein
MRQGRHFKQRWKNLVATQRIAANGREEADGDADERDGSPLRFARHYFRRNRRGWLVAGLAILSVVATLIHFGRFGPSLDRRPLHGRVQVHGVGITYGSISFLPTAGNFGPAANASILNGEYHFTKASGPGIGPHRVLIDIDSPPGRDHGPAPEQPMRDMKSIDASASPERKPNKSPTEQPPISTRRHWELEYAVSEENADRADFELDG